MIKYEFLESNRRKSCDSKRAEGAKGMKYRIEVRT